MSLTRGHYKEDVMAWDPKTLADHMRQLKLSACENVVLKRSISGAQFLHMIQHELEVFPIIYVPILAKLQRDLNRHDKRKDFGSQSKTQSHSAAVENQNPWDSGEFASESDNEYEASNREAGEESYIIPLTEPNTADNSHLLKPREQNRFQTVFSLPGPQSPPKLPYQAIAQQSALKKPEIAPPPQIPFTRLKGGSIAVTPSSLTSRHPLPTIPQQALFNRENNLITRLPVPTQSVQSNQPIISTEKGLDSSWYTGRMTRNQAEFSLRRVKKDGAFLVRDSSRGSSSHPYTLMLLHQGKIYNIKIQRQKEVYFLGSGANNTKSFLRVKEMIIHHMNTPLLLIDATDQCCVEQPLCCLLHPAGLLPRQQQA